ncbi:hypothetical protein Dsin_029857 [Dipteronia sinensis]|uniref:Protein FAR1-RELATED SEQUENCE n=1 Tax=Dipteronia sinensis TaxID=43782 RepID=A0AAD9ZUV6_9ROSI|nr:hypothetical protein Dsin_029857 [Dipteronia sinensis]
MIEEERMDEFVSKDSLPKVTVIEDDDENEIGNLDDVETNVEDPQIGKFYDSVECLFEYYKMYGKKMGFEVIKRTSNKGDDGELRNYLDKVRRLRLGEGDANAIQHYFLRMQSSSNFFYTMDLDEEGRLKNVFWADARSRAAYREFGDVLTFDTTYLTNKYDMSFAAFAEKECHADFISFNSCIPCVTHYPLEKQFQEAYTTEIFKDFQQELSANLYCEVSLDKENFPCSEFTVGENVMVGNTITTIPFTVLLKEADFEINCNCRLFEFKGILCRHVIAVLIHKKICFAPDEYILMQWRKDVIRCYTKVKIGYDNWSIKPEGHRFDKMCNSFYEVAHLATSNDDKCNIVLEMINDLKMKLISYEGDDGSIQRIINLSDDTEDKNFHSAPKENRNILTPMAVRSKGRPPFKRKQSKNLERFQSEELVTVTVDNPCIFNNIEDNFATQERIVNKVLML